VSLYLDASVLLPGFFEESASAAVEATIRDATDEVLVSDFAAAEVASAVSRLVRMQLISVADADARLSQFEAWRAATTATVELHAADARLAYTLVRRFDLMLRAPDALHLAIARRIDARLVTLDRRLSRASAALGIAVEIPGGTS
jgi:predicted nucleic acid-binding protein